MPAEKIEAWNPTWYERAKDWLNRGYRQSPFGPEQVFGKLKEEVAGLIIPSVKTELKQKMYTALAPIPGFYAGKWTPLVGDISANVFGKKVAKVEALQKLQGHGLTIKDLSTPAQPLWRVTDTKGKSQFVNPDVLTEGTYARDLGELYARIVGVDYTPEVRLAFDVGQFIGTLKRTHQATRFLTKNVAARPWLLKPFQLGISGMETDMLLQIEDVVVGKRDKFSFEDAWKTGGLFTIFGGVIEGAKATRAALADAHMARIFFRQNPEALKLLNHSDLKKMSAYGRAVQAGMPQKAAMRVYGKDLRTVIDKFDKYREAVRWRPNIQKLLPEKAGLTTKMPSTVFEANQRLLKGEIPDKLIKDLGLKPAEIKLVKPTTKFDRIMSGIDKAFRKKDLHKLEEIDRRASAELSQIVKELRPEAERRLNLLSRLIFEIAGKELDAGREITVAATIKRNPYFTMPLKRVREDAENGIALAKEAMARIDPTCALGKGVLTPATYQQKKAAHVLKAMHKLTDEQYRRAIRYATGQDSMATMNVDEAKDAIEHLSHYDDIVELVDEVIKVAPVSIDPRMPKGYNAKIRAHSGSDETFNKTIVYSNKLGGVPSNADVPGLDWRQERYAQDLINVTRMQRRAARKGVVKEEAGKHVNLVNPWSSTRYALAQAGVKSGVPLRRGHATVVAKAVGVTIENAKAIDDALKRAGASRIGSPLSFAEGKQIANWLFVNPENAPKLKATLWGDMAEPTQRIAQEIHNFLQTRNALLVRWARWIKWDRAAKRADATIQKLRDKGKKITNTRLKTIMKPVKAARPPNAPQSAIQEGRTAEEIGQLLDWLDTQTWGTRKFYYMSESELKDLTSIYPTGTIPEELEEAAALLGSQPEQVLPETMTREGMGKIAKGGALLNAVLNHANRVGVFAATYDDLTKFWKAFASTNPSPQDIARVRLLVNTSLGFRHAVEPWVKVARALNVWFWRPYFAFSPKRAAWFSYRNLHQDIAYGLTQIELKEAAKSCVVLSKAVGKSVTSGVWDEIDKINPWMREDYENFWESTISQRRQMYLQFVLQRQGNVVSDFGNQAVAIIDAIGSAPIYSDEVNRLKAWPTMHQTAYRNAQQIIQGKISAEKFWHNLNMDNLHIDQRLEMHRLIDEGNWREIVKNFAEYRTENIHFRYDTALRSIAEQTPGGRAVMGLATFPRGTFEIMYQNGFKPFVQGFESGNYRQSYEGLKTIIMGIFGSRMARWMLYAVTGRVAYGVFDTVTRYAPVAPGPRRIQELFDTINNIQWRAQEQGYDIAKTSDMIMAAVTYQSELFIPFCDVALDYYEYQNDVHGVRLYSLLKKKALQRFKDETGKAFRPASRDSNERIQHLFWGGAEEGKELKIRGMKRVKKKVRKKRK